MKNSTGQDESPKPPFYTPRVHLWAIGIALIAFTSELTSQIGPVYGIPAGLVCAYLFHITMRP